MIHPSAIVDTGAQLADDVEVGAYAVIGPDVRIGSGSKVGAHAVVTGPCEIGRNNDLYQFSSIGAAPQDKKYAGEPTRLQIGDGNTVREFCTINRGTAGGGGVTRIGNDNWIMAYTHVAHDCLVGDHIVMANNTTLAGHVSVGDYAVLGGFTKVHQFCNIGEHSFCAMDSGLSRDVPPYVMAAGHLAVPRGINAEGLRRRGFSDAQIRNIRNAYKILYRSDLRLEQALSELSTLAATQSELQPLIDFLRASERSIIR